MPRFTLYNWRPLKRSRMRGTGFRQRAYLKAAPMKSPDDGYAETRVQRNRKWTRHDAVVM